MAHSRPRARGAQAPSIGGMSLPRYFFFQHEFSNATLGHMMRLLAIFILMCPWSFAQETDMNSWLNEGNDQNRADRIVALGVPEEVASPIRSGAIDEVVWQPVRIGSTSKAAILFRPCNLSTSYLYLLIQEESWQVKDQASFDCHYDDSVSVDVNWVADPNRDELLVHHACVGHGTGYLQQNFKVLSIVRTKFQETMDTDEVLTAFPVGAPELVQRSTFTIVPLVNSRRRAIEETRSTERNGKLSVRRRYFRWSEDLKRYAPGKFKTVSAK